MVAASPSCWGRGRLETAGATPGRVFVAMAMVAIVLASEERAALVGRIGALGIAGDDLGAHLSTDELARKLGQSIRIPPEDREAYPDDVVNERFTPIMSSRFVRAE